MSSLKDIAKQAEADKSQFKNKIKKEVESNEGDIPHEKLIALSFIEGLNQYLYGVYVGYCKCKGEAILDGEDFLSELKSIPEIEQEKDKQEYLRNNSKLGTFLIWYLYE